MGNDMPLEIRRAQEADWTAIWDLTRATPELSASMTDARRQRDFPAFRRMLDRSQDCLLVAVDGREVVGVVWAQEFGPHLSTWWGSVYLHDLRVREDHRGVGIGTGLLRAVMAWGRGIGARTLELRSTPDAVGFYRRHAFTEGEPRWWAGYPIFWADVPEDGGLPEDERQ